VLYDALIRLGYGGEVPIYSYRLSMVNILYICETNVMIPLNLVEPWTETVVGSEPDTTVEQMAHVALTYLCESHLVATTAMPIALFLIWYQENPMWKQRLKAVSDLGDPHFNASMAVMAKYVQYLFSFRHKTARTIIQ
jgi:hypothetical protein